MDHDSEYRAVTSRSDELHGLEGEEQLLTATQPQRQQLFKMLHNSEE